MAAVAASCCGNLVRANRMMDLTIRKLLEAAKDLSHKLTLQLDADFRYIIKLF